MREEQTPTNLFYVLEDATEAQGKGVCLLLEQVMAPLRTLELCLHNLKGPGDCDTIVVCSFEMRMNAQSQQNKIKSRRSGKLTFG
jgi:hypothetical protein